MMEKSSINKEGDTRGRRITYTGRASFLIVFVTVTSILLLLKGEKEGRLPFLLYKGHGICTAVESPFPLESYVTHTNTHTHTHSPLSVFPRSSLHVITHSVCYCLCPCLIVFCPHIHYIAVSVLTPGTRSSHSLTLCLLYHAP